MWTTPHVAAVRGSAAAASGALQRVTPCPGLWQGSSEQVRAVNNVVNPSFSKGTSGTAGWCRQAWLQGSREPGHQPGCFLPPPCLG